ncbi:CPBP family glutamic-type intramembrane protease [Qipengyuania marisflavi]|uniref:CPBP family intramembrane metalloprotease n=1 Tax=Qipengyuania marisflavi TaxID=2486356 RepID=A0A5S3P6X9_9SPHN|nr:CPBP family glutamic-type intramembrane protease [Qipengyuania marisflavi]TMM46579.1 CPBP family intramembrane metalloprotease [Qipengyuania marisflavi]
MTGETSTLAHAKSWRGEAKRVIAFVRRPILPEKAAGISRASLAAVWRLYLLDIALMAVLLAIAGAVLMSGFEFPENEIAGLTLSPRVLALIVLLAPLIEEIGFRSWLSGRPGHVLAAAFLAFALFGLPLVFGDGGSLWFAVSFFGAMVLALGTLYALRKRGQMPWFARAFPLFFAAATISFALIHLFNYQEGTLAVLLPLVLPQLIAGTIFGYARVTYGLWASIVLHMLHNGTAIGLVLLATSAAETAPIAG